MTTTALRRDATRGWWLMLLGAIGITLYALSFHVRRAAAFPPTLVDSFNARPWGIYLHVVFGPLALAIGAFQFRRDLLRNRPRHRLLGKLYVIGAFMTGVIGMYMSIYSFGGWTTHLGFGFLGMFTATTTALAYVRIRALDVVHHREWMIRSYALIFAAVTLRIELPLLVILFRGDFPPAYGIVSWLSWAPNIIWAEWYVRASRRRVEVPAHSRV